MSIRQDLTINWAVSPRIIEVAAPSTDLAVQDLYDTIRSLSVEAIDEPEIIDGSGKEVLSPTELVGLTVKLVNAKVKFEDRTSPTDCDISGGNLVALDADNHPMNPIQYAPFVTVTYAKSSSATLVSVEDMRTDLAFIKQIEQGRWKIVNKQMIFYGADGSTPIKTFDLKDKNGQPTELDAYERVPA